MIIFKNLIHEDRWAYFMVMLWFALLEVICILVKFFQFIFFNYIADVKLASYLNQKLNWKGVFILDGQETCLLKESVVFLTVKSYQK